MDFKGRHKLIFGTPYPWHAALDYLWRSDSHAEAYVYSMVAPVVVFGALSPGGPI